MVGVLHEPDAGTRVGGGKIEAETVHAENERIFRRGFVSRGALETHAGPVIRRAFAERAGDFQHVIGRAVLFPSDDGPFDVGMPRAAAVFKAELFHVPRDRAVTLRPGLAFRQGLGIGVEIGKIRDFPVAGGHLTRPFERRRFGQADIVSVFDLRRRQRAVVDRHLVKRAGPVFGRGGFAAKFQFQRIQYNASHVRVGDCFSIEISLNRRTLLGNRQVLPGVCAGIEAGVRTFDVVHRG